MNAFKDFVRDIVPPVTLHRAKMIVQRQRIRRSGAEAAFNSSPRDPAWLPQSMIGEIEAEYRSDGPGSFGSNPYGYSDEVVLRRAKRRARFLRRIIGADYSNCNRFIEAGAADSMVAWALMKSGKEVMATDVQDDTLDKRAVMDKVPFALMSASDLKVPDGSYDVLYSFASLEHYDDPTRAMAEAARVVRPGGYVYLNFGPQYQAVDGMHLGTRLQVPFASVLFTRSDIDAYMEESGREPLNHEYCNGWTLDEYRTLFKSIKSQFETIIYLEHYDLTALDMISRFPSCFRAKSENMDSFLVSVIDILLRRRYGPDT